MKLNNIIYADLSTYTPAETITFYQTVFGWKYYQDQGNYLAYSGSIPVAGLYETPEKFKQMRMPHFWMTYMQVNSVSETVSKAKLLGGIIEVQSDLPAFGKVALIRDPQGAGFTIYEGNSLEVTRTSRTVNTMIWNEIHVSDLQKIIPFYQGIFDWTFEKINDHKFGIYNGQNEHIADAMEIPNEYKGKYEYWVCTFGVRNLEDTKRAILENKGGVVIDEGSRILVTDNSKQAFFYIQEV